MLSIHQLPADRYPELPIKFNPASSIVVVAEDDNTNEIKGICAAMGTTLLEMWTTPDGSARGRTGLKMFAELLSALAANGDPFYYAFADTPEVADYLQRLGLTELPYKVFIGINPLLPQEQKECLSQELFSPPSSVVVQDSVPQP